MILWQLSKTPRNNAKINLRGIVYYTCNKEPPENGIGNYLGPYD